MITKDFKLDSDGDLFIDAVTNDFVIEESDQQHIMDIMQAVPGWFKQFSLVGFNPYQYLNGRVSPTDLNKNAKIQLQADGYTQIVTDLTQDKDNKLEGNVFGKRL